MILRRLASSPLDILQFSQEGKGRHKCCGDKFLSALIEQRGAQGGGGSVTKYGWSKIPHWSWFPTSTRVCLTKVICVQSVVRLIEQFVTSLCANTGSDPAPYSSASGAALCEKFNEAHQSGFLLEVFRELRFKYPCMHLNDNKTPSMTNAFLKMRNTVVRSVLVPI